jgi:superfamily II DNA or RNA helicase
VSDLLNLRPYQVEAVEAVEADWRAGVRRAAVAMATGTGKTLTATHIIDRHRQEFGLPTLFLVHRDELAYQSAETFGRFGLDVGVVKAGQNDVGAPVMVGSVQTLNQASRRGQLPDLGLIVIDEAHHASAASYRSILTHVGAYAPDSPCVALGLSATLVRGDGSGLRQVWEKVSYKYDILDAITSDPPYLTDVVGQLVTVDGMSLSDVRMTGGDFQSASLSEILSSKAAIDTVVAAYTEHAREMPGFVFTPDVDSAKRYAAAFQGADYVAEAVWGDMPLDDRRLIMKRARAGDVQILVNCGIFTEGTDLPRFQCAVIARPTTNEGLYIQMVGRVLRPHPDKLKINGGKALVLDVAGVSRDHRLATLADLSSRRIVEVRPGESLREAAQREIRSRNPNLAGYVISSEEVDLFHRSRSVWLQTHGGIWFVPVGNAVVYLHPAKQDGLYHVGVKPLDIPGKTRPVKLDLPLDLAMSWGEQYAEEYGQAWQARTGKSFGQFRNARWRRGEASASSVEYARSLGIEVSGRPRAGELSCIIEVNRASRVLDGKGIN